MGSIPTSLFHQITPSPPINHLLYLIYKRASKFSQKGAQLPQSWVLWDSERRMTVLARTSSNLPDWPINRLTDWVTEQPDIHPENSNWCIWQNIGKPSTSCGVHSWKFKSYIFNIICWYAVCDFVKSQSLLWSQYKISNSNHNSFNEVSMKNYRINGYFQFL